MEENKVPQDNISTYANNKKAIYAINDNGEYGIVSSSGWEVEEEATRQALYELQRQADEAYDEVASGLRSPLYSHMYARRMDLQLLAESMGMFKWRIRRHLKPAVFEKLPKKMLQRYADVLGISVAKLCSLPKKDESDA
ncbi:MAG: hypothetical protein R3302_04265 [Sulfurimonadaceae bacterium]|nr:hypothetical protein [Sulfurimonadaceae bacterium]